jgi:hypothetical protein
MEKLDFSQDECDIVTHFLENSGFVDCKNIIKWIQDENFI